MKDVMTLMLMIYLNMLESEEDRNKFEQVYLEYRGKMYNIAYGILGNVQDAEDAVQQAFLNIANNFTKISQSSCKEMQGYMVTIIRNEAIKIYNRNKKASERTTEYDDDITVDDNCFDEADHSELRRAIESLSPVEKDIIFLFYYKEMSAKEISKLLNISVNNVWTRLHRARASIKNNLGRGGKNEQ